RRPSGRTSSRPRSHDRELRRHVMPSSILELDDSVVVHGLPTRGVLHDEKFSVRTLRVLEQLQRSVRLSQLEEYGAILLDLLNQGCPFFIDSAGVPSMETKPRGHRQRARDAERAQGIGPEVNAARQFGGLDQS